MTCVYTSTLLRYLQASINTESIARHPNAVLVIYGSASDLSSRVKSFLAQYSSGHDVNVLVIVLLCSHVQLTLRLLDGIMGALGVPYSLRYDIAIVGCAGLITSVVYLGWWPSRSALVRDSKCTCEGW